MNPSGMFASNGDGATDNPTPTRDVYAAASGATLGTAAGGTSLSTTGSTAGVNGTTSANKGTAGAGVLGQPLTWWATIVVLFFVVGLVAKKAGNATEFSNVRLSGYNILMITLAAIIGIAGLKVLFARFPVPGISTLLAAV